MSTINRQQEIGLAALYIFCFSVHCLFGSRNFNFFLSFFFFGQNYYPRLGKRILKNAFSFSYIAVHYAFRDVSSFVNCDIFRVMGG